MAAFLTYRALIGCISDVPCSDWQTPLGCLEECRRLLRSILGCTSRLCDLSPQLDLIDRVKEVFVAFLTCVKTALAAHGQVCIFFFKYKAFRRVETLFVQPRYTFVQGTYSYTFFIRPRYTCRNILPSRPVIGYQGLFTFRQPIAGLQGTGFYLG